MEDIKPVFIVCTGRCGSQLFYRMLAHHHSFNWFTRMEQKWPNSTFFKVVSSFVSNPIIYGILEPRVQPSEAYSQWEKADPALLSPFRSLRKEDVTEKKRAQIRRLVKNRSGKKRLLAKYTGWSMIPYFKEIFPEAKFIHILRDGRAVVNSFLHTNWGSWEGIHNWSWGFKKEYVEEIKKYNCSYAAIVALQWKLITREIKEAGNNVGPEFFMEIKYEDLVKDHIKIINEVLSFLREESYPSFEKALRSYKTKNMNYKWKKNLCKSEKNILAHSLKDVLREYGYIKE